MSTPAALKEIQVTHNSSDKGVYKAALSADGRYLAFVDSDGLQSPAAPLKIDTAAAARELVAQGCPA
jgi:hypothetical protein